MNIVSTCGRKFRKIVQILKRDENQIKNEFDKKILPQLLSQQRKHEESKKMIQYFFDLPISHDQELFRIKVKS